MRCYFERKAYATNLSSGDHVQPLIIRLTINTSSLSRFSSATTISLSALIARPSTWFTQYNLLWAIRSGARRFVPNNEALSFDYGSVVSIAQSDHSKQFIRVTKEFLTQEGLKESSSSWGSHDDVLALSSFFSAEISPVCVVMGGILGNEIIKAITGKGEPANNILMFDGIEGSCQNFTINQRNTNQ